jgi:hypothetical protein
MGNAGGDGLPIGDKPLTPLRPAETGPRRAEPVLSFCLHSHATFGHLAGGTNVTFSC